MSEHTPGPWETSGTINARYLSGIGDVTLVRRGLAEDNRYVAMTSLDAMGFGNHAETSEAERDANARLIAAAPDMLGALKQVRARFQGLRLGPDEAATLDRVHAAIAKAEGSA